MLYVLGRGYIMKWLDHDFLHRYLIVDDVLGGFSFIQLSFLTYIVLKYFPENTQKLDRVQPLHNTAHTLTVQHAKKIRWSIVGFSAKLPGNYAVLKFNDNFL